MAPMRVLVLGADAIGQAVADDLARQPGITAVGLVDADGSRLTTAGQAIEHGLARRNPAQPGARIEGHRVEFERLDDQARATLFDGHRVAVNCLVQGPRLTLELARSALKSRAHVVDLSAQALSPGVLEPLDLEAKKAGLVVVPGLGHRQGLLDLLAAWAATRMDEVMSSRTYSGSVVEVATSQSDTLHDRPEEIVHLRSEVLGMRGDRRRKLTVSLEQADETEQPGSARAHLDALPGAVAAYQLAAGAIDGFGVLSPEQALPLSTFVAAMRARGVRISEQWEDG